MCIKYDPCKDLLECLKSLEDTDVDPFEEIPEDEVSLEGVPELTMDSDNSDEVEGVVIAMTVHRNSFTNFCFVFIISPPL